MSEGFNFPEDETTEEEGEGNLISVFFKSTGLYIGMLKAAIFGPTSFENFLLRGP